MGALKRIRSVTAAVACAVVLYGGVCANSVDAQPFPSKPLRYVVTGSPGSGADTLGRLVAESLSQSLGRQVVVENRAGGGSNLAAEIVATVVPDRRSAGYGLARFQDHPRLDFSRLAQAPGVHFAHARGFVAKSSLTAPTDLRALLLLAANSSSLPA